MLVDWLVNSPPEVLQERVVVNTSLLGSWILKVHLDLHSEYCIRGMDTALND
jgi:uncharacterized membrane protein YeiH